ncbi:MAG: hypothetical protein E6G94_02860 [Alphaproteobacteria bacterium]|nr:MAG: hypothetical protein E6G94_02860 [Alphaproteobacteria bacterium]
MAAQSRFLWLLAAAALPSCQQAPQQQAAAPDASALAPLYVSTDCDTPTTPFCNSKVAPPQPLPPGWPAQTFVLSQTYPTAAPADKMPWLAFDPKTEPEQFIGAVLAYFYEGNVRPDVATSFDPKLNSVRGWYNAPWQDFGPNGREPIHGLTRERVSLPYELDPKNQKSSWNNYAVGFYNAPGGVTLGSIWADHGKPNYSSVSFPEGTVAGKLLFTTANEAEAPFLAGSPAWQAYVYQDVHNPTPKPTDPRAVTMVRLLQIDVAVKDKRAPLGWVFGTFVYGGGPPPGGKSGSGWTNVAPVGLMWGNDPPYRKQAALQETWLNPAVQMPHVGYQGRLDGPVDNPASSCMSCHSTAQMVSGDAKPPPMVPAVTGDPMWFRNIPSGQPFAPGGTSVDYSLQVWVGLNNFLKAQKLAQAPSPEARNSMVADLVRESARPPRDGGTHH